MFTFSNSQLKFISDVLVSMGQVFMASLIIEYFVKSLDFGFLLSGIMLAPACWIVGLIINSRLT